MKPPEGGLRDRVRCSSSVDQPILPPLGPCGHHRGDTRCSDGLPEVGRGREPLALSGQLAGGILESPVVDMLKLLRGPGESYSDVILRLAAADT